MKMNFKHLVYCISFFIPFCVEAHEGDYRPIEFVQNKGQWDGPFAYKATFGNVNVFLEKNAFTYVVGAQKNNEKAGEYRHGKTDALKDIWYHAYKVHLLNSNNNPEIKGSKAQEHYYNFYLGNDQAKWKDHIYPNLAVDYKNIYNGIDLHVASEGRNIKYDFIVAPKGNTDVIQLQYEGVNEIKIKDDNLFIKTSIGEIYEMAPFAYQYINGDRKQVPCKYRLKGNVLSYHFPKGYNKSVTLVIDPQIVFATFTGSQPDNWGNTATYDALGNFYAGGVAGGTGYPNPTNIGQPYQGGDGADGNMGGILTDITITKFNPTGSAIIYSTYLGGSSQEQPNSMVVDNNGNLYIAGRTFSSNFPVTTSTYNGAADIIVTKLNNNGTLNASRFMGGSSDDGVNISALYGTVASLKHSYADDGRSEILLDNAGDVYVAACTKSGNFPLTNATKNSLTGAQDGVAFKLSNNLSNIIWSTYIGGNSDDAAYVLAFNKSQSSVYVSGGTASNNFTGSGGIWNTYQGGIADGFIIKYQNSGSYGIQRSTLIGRGGYDQCFGIQVDDENNVYVTGNSLGGTFPVSGGVYSNAGGSQFVMKLDSNISTSIYSTVYGSGTSTVVDITPVAFLVDTCQNVYISGWGGSAVGQNGSSTANLPVNLATSPPVPTGIISATSNGSGFYFIVLSKNAVSLLFGGHYSGGGPVSEHVDGGTSRFDRNGVIYQAICGGCGGSNLVNTTAGAYSRTNGSTRCNLVALKIAFNFGSVAAKAAASPNGVVCLGDPINFSSAGSSNATNFEWNFGDGNNSTSASPTYTYTIGGTFQVRLIAINPNACKTRDTSYLTVRVDTNSIKADFTVVQTDSCKPFNALITNTSKAGGSTTYQWLFGDGKSFTGFNPGTHEYPDTGTYTITLIIHDPAACNPDDTISKTISFNTVFVKALFESPPVICEKTKALLNNRSEKATTFLWKFGDGKTSTESNPAPMYDTAGTYIITLYAYNPKSCNGVDSISHAISVESTPVANFRYDPIIPITNDPVNFTNMSLRATHYIWDFGDNTFSQLETPQPKYYKKTGTYRVCLQAQNLVGCSDTICKYVDADVYPLADVPKGFSPNGDGKNDILYVRGAGVEVVDLKIYNRWGEMVFETTDMNIGWDGKYKGKEAPMEAYAFVLNVTFVDGTTFYKKGNVTLLR